MEVQKTQRGFECIAFLDRSLQECTIQQSSAIGDEDDAFERPGSSCLWLGVDSANPQVMASQAESVGVVTDQTVGWVPYPIPEGVQMTTRMHLGRSQVQELIAILQRWVDTGRLS